MKKSLLRLLFLTLPLSLILSSGRVLETTGQTVPQRTHFGKKFADDFSNGNPQETIDVIVQFREAPTAVHHAKVISRGGALKTELGLVNGAAYTIPAGAIKDLASDPDVAYISPDRSLQGMGGPGGPGGPGAPQADTSATLDYYDATTNATGAWQWGYDGTGVGVAVIDSGIIDISDLHNGPPSRVVYSQDFVGGGPATAAPATGGAVDKFGHGSHVAGIVGGNGKDSSGPGYTYTFKGIAPNVNLINLRVLDQNGQGTDSRVISAINTAINLKAKYNIRVINLSLGRPVYESFTLDPLCQAVEKAWQAGIVVVVAAGNEGRNNTAGTNGYGTITAPGNDPFVITVGAMKTMGTPNRGDDLIASYSSKGPTAFDHIVKPDIVAPGNRIISLYSANLTLPTEYPGNEIPMSLYQSNGPTTASPYYYRLSGTSMAAPMVSGTAALMLQQNPSLTPDQVKARLMKTASKSFPTSSISTDPVTGQIYTSYYDIFTVGAGYLDIVAALNNRDLVRGSALSPRVVYDSKTGRVHMQGGLLSGSTIIWDDTIIWDETIIWDDTIVWGDTIVWDDSVSGQTIIWDDATVWSDGVSTGFFNLWGSSALFGTSGIPTGESVAIAVFGEN